MSNLSMENYNSSFKAYFSLFRIKAVEGFAYRLAALSGATISIFWVLIEILVYTVFYHHSDHPTAGLLAGLSLPQVTTYVWLAQIMFLMQPMSVDNEILSKIQSGDVALELCRPLDLYYHWLAKNIAGRLAPLTLRGSILLFAGILAPSPYKISPPASITALLCYLLSLISALLLCSVYVNLICVLRLSINWGDGPTYILLLIGGVLSGTYLPLQLWPDFLQRFLLFQPFAGYLDIPLRFYLGTLPPDSLPWAIGLQIAWILIFLLLGKWLMYQRLRKIILQGG